jgi:hypothetical protein
MSSVASTASDRPRAATSSRRAAAPRARHSSALATRRLRDCARPSRSARSSPPQDDDRDARRLQAQQLRARGVGDAPRSSTGRRGRARRGRSPSARSTSRSTSRGGSERGHDRELERPADALASSASSAASGGPARARRRRAGRSACRQSASPECTALQLAPPRVDHEHGAAAAARMGEQGSTPPLAPGRRSSRRRPPRGHRRGRPLPRRAGNPRAPSPSAAPAWRSSASAPCAATRLLVLAHAVQVEARGRCRSSRLPSWERRPDSEKSGRGRRAAG